MAFLLQFLQFSKMFPQQNEMPNLLFSCPSLTLSVQPYNLTNQLWGKQAVLCQKKQMSNEIHLSTKSFNCRAMPQHMNQRPCLSTDMSVAQEQAQTQLWNTSVKKGLLFFFFRIFQVFPPLVFTHAVDVDETVFLLILYVGFQRVQ